MNNNGYARGFEQCRKMAASAVCERCKTYLSNHPDEEEFGKSPFGEWIHGGRSGNVYCIAGAIWDLPCPDDPERPQ